MTKFLIVFVVVGIMSYAMADPIPDPWRMQNPALDMLERMNQGQFPMPQMPAFPQMPVFHKIEVTSPEDMVKNLKASGKDSVGAGSYMSSRTWTDENGKVHREVEGQTVLKDGDKVEVNKFGNKP